MTQDGDGFHHDLKPPSTRAAQAWTRFWQRYVGDGPAKLIRMNHTTIQGIRRIGTRR